MTTRSTGEFIARKRKEQQFTQEQLAEKLGVSNKTVSKWETGKCMPDYSLVQALCEELHITAAELLDGKEKDPSAGNDAQMTELLGRVQELEKQKRVMYAVLLIVLGIAEMALSFTLEGTGAAESFISGALLGIACPMMLLGVYFAMKNLAGR